MGRASPGKKVNVRYMGIVGCWVGGDELVGRLDG